MATIRKRGELQWQAIVKRKGYPLQSKTWTTRKDAEVWARAIETEMDRGAFVARGEVERTTIADIVERYEKHELLKLRGKGFACAAKALKTGLGAYSLAVLSSKIVADYRQKRLREGRSGDTVRKELNLLSLIIDLAGKEWGLSLPANPCALVSRPAPGKPRTRRLEGDEESRLLAACGDDKQLRALVVVAIESAARLGELLAAKWSDFAPKEDAEPPVGVLFLHGIDRRGTKNGDAVRGVPLSSRATAAIEGLRALPRSDDGRIFWHWSGSDGFNKRWRRLCAAAGIEGLRFHDLRHEATSRLFERGDFGDMEITGITGHADPRMAKRYTHMRAERLAIKLG